MSRKSGDLYDSTDTARGSPFENMAEYNPHTFPDEWTGGSWDSITETTSGPYCVGDTVKVKGVFSGVGDHFPSIRTDSDNYTREGSTNVNFISTQSGVFTYEAASTGTGQVDLSFASPFSQLTNEGSIYSVTFSIVSFNVNIIGSTYDSGNDNVIIDYDISCGSANYSVDLYRDVDSTAELAATDTKSSTGSYSITDTNPHSNDNSDDYRIEVTDGGGTTDTDTTTVNFPI